jgi:hypothetical protein
MKRECVAAGVSVEIEPRMQLEEISTSVVGLQFSIDFRPQVAPLRHARLSKECQFTGVDRKSPWSGQADANDPQRTSQPVKWLCVSCGKMDHVSEVLNQEWLVQYRLVSNKAGLPAGP